MTCVRRTFGCTFFPAYRRMPDIATSSATVRSLFIGIALCFVSAAATAEIFKCVKGKGTVVYQNFPCDLDSLDSPGTSVASSPRGSNEVFADFATTPRTADGKYEPRIGMTRAQVKQLSWGEPSEIDKYAGDKKRAEMWTYDRKRALWFDEHGRLSAVKR
jgi:hypothetical protein